VESGAAGSIGRGFGERGSCMMLLRETRLDSKETLGFPFVRKLSRFRCHVKLLLLCSKASESYVE
jgi:hypothetical protein